MRLFPKTRERRRQHQRERILVKQIEDVGADGWTCMVCGDYRPDQRISVHSSTHDTPGGFAVKTNVRYCNDRPSCEEGARKVDIFSGKW